MKKRLGELLVEKKVITRVQLDHALARQANYGGRLGENLVKAGMVTESELMRFVAAQTGIKEVNLSRFRPDPATVKIISRKVAMKYMVLPLKIKDHKTLVVACVDPMDLNALDDVSFITGYRVEPVVAPYSTILRVLNNFYSAVPLADNHEVHGEAVETAAGGGHASIADPDLIIFGEQTDSDLQLETGSIDSARPLEPPPQVEEEEDEFTLDFSPISEETSRPTQPSQSGQFTMNQKMKAALSLLIKKGLITQQELEKELQRLWSLGKLG